MMYEYLDIVLIGLVLSFGWMVYRLVMKGREFQEKWEDLPEETRIFIRDRHRHPLLRMLWNTFRQDIDIVLAGGMVMVMIIVVLWILS
ncbi:MAG: hypothetical protein N2314_00430 [Brevinematales bacterium]|nr:hypothetical protein [Brevinematales bacterium]